MILTLLCWTGQVENEVKNGANSFWHFVAGWWPILRFPLITLFGRYVFIFHSFAYGPVLTFLNCAFYGLIIERIIYLRKRKSDIPPAESAKEP